MRVVILLLIAILYGCASTATDVFYVRGATFSDSRHKEFISGEKSISDYLEEVKKSPYPRRADFEWAGHRIGAGRGNILALRRFFDESTSYIDDETYFKLTIWVPELPQEKGSTIELDGKEVISFWSGGASAFPGRGVCLEYADAGSVAVTRLNDTTLSIDVNLQFGMKNIRDGSDECPFSEFKEILTAKEKALADLTPWDGREGSHYIEETMR